MHQEENCHRRVTDTWQRKLIYVASIITACAAVTGATVKILGYEFVPRSEFVAQQSVCRVADLNTQINITRLEQKLDDVGADVKDIKHAIERK